MIQDIAPKRLYNEYMPADSAPDDYVAVFVKNKILVINTEDSLRLPKMREASAVLTSGVRYEYLFRIEDESYFLYQNSGPACAAADDFEKRIQERQDGDDGQTKLTFMKLSEIRYQAERELCFAVYTAWHLYRWYRDNRFCGRCGALVRPDGKERMLYCPECGNQIFPRISPAVIAAVTDGDRILLSKYANREYKRYALIAGFAEIGEMLEQTVQREVMEEVGLRVKNIRYYKTQPWGIDGNLLTGYFAQLDGSSQIRLDKNELASAEWVHREDLKDMDDGFSLTREMMRAFYEGHP